MAKSVITFVAALSCEAKPLLDFHRAKKICDKPFTLFCAKSSEYDIEVLISGIGALPMATAVGWLGAFRPSAHRAWLNVGTAGHGSMELGEPFRVHASSDILSDRKYFPPLVARSPFVGDEILSVNAPTDDYPDQGGMDMEAYAFFNAATRFSSSELVQGVKVVSDNPQHGLESLNAQTISALMQPHAQEINQFARSVLDSALPVSAFSLDTKQKKDKVVFPDIRITHSQQQQLEALVAKLFALDGLPDDLQSDIMHTNSFKELSGLLRSRLDCCVPKL